MITNELVLQRMHHQEIPSQDLPITTPLTDRAVRTLDIDQPEQLLTPELSPQLRLLEELHEQFARNPLDEYTFNILRQKLELFQTPDYRLNLNETKSFYNLLLAVLTTKIDQGALLPVDQFMQLSFDLLKKGHPAVYEQLYFPLLQALDAQQILAIPYLEQCLDDATQARDGKPLVEEVRRHKVLVPLLKMNHKLQVDHDGQQNLELVKETIKELSQSKYFPDDSLIDATELFVTLEDQPLVERQQKVAVALSRIQERLINSAIDDQSENQIKVILHFIQVAHQQDFDCTNVEGKLTAFITQAAGYKTSRAEIFLSYYQVILDTQGGVAATRVLEEHIAFLQTSSGRWFEPNKNFIFADACISSKHVEVFKRVLIEIRKNPTNLTDPKFLFYENLVTDSPNPADLRQKIIEHNGATTSFSQYINTLEKIIQSAGEFGDKNILTYFQEYLGCTRDDHAKNVQFSDYLPAMYQELTKLVEQEPTSADTVKLMTLLDSQEGLSTTFNTLLSNSAPPELRQEMFEQLAFQVHRVAPEITRFWLQTGVIRATYQKQPQITQELAQLHSLAKREGQLESVVFNQEMTQAVTTLTQDYKVITQGSKLQYLSSERLLAFAKQLSECTEMVQAPQDVQEGRRYAQQLGKFIKTIINNYASSTLEGCLWCISDSLLRAKAEQRMLDSLTEVDWTDKKEQQCLVEAVADLGSVSPMIFTRYRQLWFEVEEHSAPGFVLTQQEASTVSVGQRRNESILRDAPQAQTERRAAAQSKLESLKTRAQQIQLAMMQVLEGPRSQLNHFVRTAQLLRQSFYLNKPLFEQKNISLARRGQDKDDMLIEYIFTFFKPIGKSITKVRQEVRALKPVEAMLVQQVADAGIIFEPTEYTLETKHTIYEVLPEDGTKFEANKKSLAQKLSYLSSDHKLILSTNGRSIDDLIAVLKAPTQRSHELLVLYRQMAKARETFGVWWDDHAHQLRVESFEQENVDNIRREIQSITQYLMAVMKIKYDEANSELTKVQAHVSKNVASYFAKASVGLCTADDIELFKRKDHFHCNIVDSMSGEVIANLQLYLIPQSYLDSRSTDTRNALLIRGLNPSSRVVNSENAQSWMAIFFAVAKKIAEQSGLSGVYVVDGGQWHEHSNRAEMITELQSFYQDHPAIKLETPFLIRAENTHNTYATTVYKVE